MTLHRRALLGASLAGASTFLPVVRAMAQPLTPTSITVVSGNTLSVTSLELVNALTGGHFQTAGLRVDLQAANTGVAGTQQLVAGRCQITRINAIDVFKAVSRHKAPLVAIANLEQQMSYMIVSAADRPVPTAADLVGKRVGVLAVGSTTDAYLDLMLRSAGVALDKVERQVVPNTPAAFVHVRQGRLDAIVMTREMAFGLEHAGEPHMAWSMARDIRMPGRCYVTTRDVAENRPELIVTFLRALLASMREISVGLARPIIDRAATGYAMPSFGSAALSEAIVANNAASWLAHGPDNLLRCIPDIWRDARVALAAGGMATVEDETMLYTNRFVTDALAA